MAACSATGETGNLQPQGLLPKLRQMIAQGGFADGQIGSGFPPGSQQFWPTIRRKGNDRQVCDGSIRLDLFNRTADAPCASQSTKADSGDLCRAASASRAGLLMGRTRHFISYGRFTNCLRGISCS